MLTLIEYNSKIDFHIDQLFFNDPIIVGSGFPAGRLAPVTAINFILLAIAVLIAPAAMRRPKYGAAQYLAFVTFVISLHGCIGYLTGVRFNYGFAYYTQMAVHTAFAFLLICMGFFLSMPGHGFMKVLTAKSRGANEIRIIVLAVCLIPALMGMATQKGLALKLYDSDFEVLLRLFANTCFILIIVLRSGSILHESELRQRASQDRIRQSEKWFRILSDALPQLVWKSDAQGAFSYVNSNWPKYTGMGSETFYGTAWLELVHADDRPSVLSWWKKAREDGNPFQGELRLKAHDGSYKWFLIRAVPAPDSSQKDISYIGVITDIDQQVRTAEALKVSQQDLEARISARTQELVLANAELEAFSYSVSHDLRAPLRSISGFGKMLVDEYKDQLDVEGKQYVDRIRAATAKMSNLIDSLLMLARISRQPLRKRHVNLSDLAKEVCSELRSTNIERLIEFRIKEQITAQCDRELIRVALTNLLGNSWKYSSKHPSAVIEFGSAQRDGHPVYYIRDDGAGFDMAFAKQLFGAFQRLHSEKEFEGTGIGLATVRRIIHLHGGEIWAESEVERGATFFFTLSV